MGSGSTKPRETDLHGSRFLALCAAEADGDTTTHVRVRLLIRGERRTLQVYSPDGVVCTTIDQQGVDHDIGNVLASDGAMSATFDWKLSRLKCFFRFRKRDGDTITIRFESIGTLRYSWISEYELTYWEPDTKRETCPLCDIRFSSFTRKHHCRCCGRLCCYQCSLHKAVLPVPATPSLQFPFCLLCSTDTRPDAPVRVCDTCYYFPDMPLDGPSDLNNEDITNEYSCHYDSSGILHLDIPSNQIAILMHRSVSPSWKSDTGSY
eukprot:TRINITY_DN10630_c0_g5_i1.p1 TRINITY_DN10630_c0_g5~~TRINITY_DN10630_c0_g5_i1.p1  ORF type:complete len:264 (+),score=33.36 TRINITY_DN10630_c0_g5_i1:43-834(+)